MLPSLALRHEGWSAAHHNMYPDSYADVSGITGLQVGDQARPIHALIASGRYVAESFVVPSYPAPSSNVAHTLTSFVQAVPNPFSPSSIETAAVNQSGLLVADWEAKGGEDNTGTKAGEMEVEVVGVANVCARPDLRFIEATGVGREGTGADADMTAPSLLPRLAFLRR